LSFIALYQREHNCFVDLAPNQKKCQYLAQSEVFQDSNLPIACHHPFIITPADKAYKQEEENFKIF